MRGGGGGEAEVREGAYSFPMEDIFISVTETCFMRMTVTLGNNERYRN